MNNIELTQSTRCCSCLIFALQKSCRKIFHDVVVKNLRLNFVRLCKFKKNNFKGGYVALMAILIISFILLSVIITANFEGFWGLSNFLNRESKEISVNLAESCLDQAIVNIIQGPSWRPLPEGEVLVRGEYFCTIRSLERNSPDVTIETVGEFNKSFTILRAEFNEETFEIVSLEELNN